MNFLDLIIIAAALGYALTGYWSGFLAGIASTLGMLVGIVTGALVAPLLLFGAGPGPWTSVFAVAIVIGVTASIQGVFVHFAHSARDRITSNPSRVADALGGALVGGLGNAAAIALVAGALAGIPHVGIADAIRSSTIVTAADTWKPAGTDLAAAKFVDVIDSTGFTLHADPFIPDVAPIVDAADEAVLDLRPVKQAGKSVLRVTGVNACGTIVEGSSFLYAPNRLMTNAHVVSGVERPEILMPWGPSRAKVVYFDDKTDLAVLALDTKSMRPLEFDASGVKNDQAAALGFPEFGAFNASAIRVRGEQLLRSGDVHGEGTVLRDVFTLRGDVRPGNSGGPLISETGTVIGVIFANSLTGASTAYAMTAEQAGDAAASGIANSKRVPVGTCIQT